MGNSILIFSFSMLLSSFIVISGLRLDSLSNYHGSSPQLIVDNVGTSSGKTKVDELMSNIEQSEYEYTEEGLKNMKKNGLTNPSCLASFFWSSMNPTFDNDSDEFVPKNRKKYIHPSGNVGSVSYSSIGDHGFTGMWGSGNPNCAVRLSLAADPKSGSFTPGMAIKCFTNNNKPSANFIAMYSLTGQGKDTNFFSNSFSNVIGEPTGFLSIIAQKFRLYSKCPIFLSLHQLAEVDDNGVDVLNPKYPKKITLVPSAEIANLIPSDSQNDFRKDLKELVPIGTELWQVYALVQGSKQQIGTIRTTSLLRSSSYGDEVLFFQHSKGDMDHCNSDEL